MAVATDNDKVMPLALLMANFKKRPPQQLTFLDCTVALVWSVAEVAGVLAQALTDLMLACLAYPHPRQP